MYMVEEDHNDDMIHYDNMEYVRNILKEEKIHFVCVKSELIE